MAASHAPSPTLEAFDPLLTVPQLCNLLSISRSTFYYWRQTGKGPDCVTLPNGALRVRLSALDAFLRHLEEEAA